MNARMRQGGPPPIVVQTMIVIGAWFEGTRWVLWLRGGAPEHMIMPMLRAGRP
jgi:hypothetical protein